MTKFIQKDDEAENEAADAAPPSVQRSIIEEMELPEQLKDALLENNNSEVYEALGVSSFTHYVSRYLANSLINIISFFCCLQPCSADCVFCPYRSMWSPGCDHIGAEPSGRCRVGGRGRDLFRLDCSTAYYTVLGNGDW